MSGEHTHENLPEDPMTMTPDEAEVFKALDLHIPGSHSMWIAEQIMERVKREAYRRGENAALESAHRFPAHDELDEAYENGRKAEHRHVAEILDDPEVRRVAPFGMRHALRPFVAEVKARMGR